MPIPIQIAIDAPSSPGAGTEISVSRFRDVWIHVGGSWTGDVRVEISADGVSWSEVGDQSSNADQPLQIPAAAQWVRVRTVSVVGSINATIAGFEVRDGKPLRVSRSVSVGALLGALLDEAGLPLLDEAGGTLLEE